MPSLPRSVLTDAISASCAFSSSSLAARSCSGRLPHGSFPARSRANLDREVELKLVLDVAAELADLRALALRQIVAELEKRTVVVALGVAGQALRQIALAQRRLRAEQIHLQRIRGHRIQLDVRHHADALNRNVSRREILRDRELERGAVGRDPRKHQLHGALAERGLPDDHRTLVVLERASHDLAGARRRPAGQHDQRVTRFGARALRALFLAPFAAAGGGNDHAVFQETVGDFGGLIEQPTGIAAQIDHQSAHPLFLLQIAERRLELVGRAALKLLDPDVADPAAEWPAFDALDLDFLAHQLEGPRAGPALVAVSMHPDRDLGARFAAQATDRVVERHVQRGFVVDLGDSIEALQPRAPGRRSRHRSHDRQHLVADRDHDSEAAEVTRGRQVHLPVSFRAHEHAVRVQRAQHAVARGVLDFAQVELGVLEIALQESEHLAQARRYVPRTLNVVDAERPLLGVDANLDVRRLFFVQDDDLCDFLLDLIERAQKHLPRLDAVRVDVFSTIVLSVSLTATSCVRS